MALREGFNFWLKFWFNFSIVHISFESLGDVKQSLFRTVFFGQN